MRFSGSKSLQFFLIPGFILFTNCSTYSQTEITGRYHSKEFGVIEQAYLYYFRNTTFVVRSSLTINPDSTYELENCGNIETGYWRVQKHHLLLYCKKNRYRIDSLNESSYKGNFLDCGDCSPDVYEIDKNLLKQKNQSKERIILNYFRKGEN